MASRLNPYIGFSDNARQAMEFYRGVFGGELTLSTFGENGMADSPDADKIMHSQRSRITVPARRRVAGRSFGAGTLLGFSVHHGHPCRRSSRRRRVHAASV